MWPTLSIGDKFLLSLQSTCFLQRVLTTGYYRVDSITGPDVHIDELSDEFVTELLNPGNMIDDYVAVIPDHASLDQIWVQAVEYGIDGLRARKIVYPQGIDGTGGDSTNIVTQIAVTKSAVRAARNTIGTLRVPCSAVSPKATNGLWSAGTIALAQAFADEIKRGYVLTVGGTTVGFSPIFNHGFGVANFDRVFAVEVQPEVRTQRTRVVGRGE